MNPVLPTVDNAAHVALAHRLAMLDSILTAISAAPDLTSLLDVTLDTVLEVRGVDGGGVWLSDDPVAGLRLAVHRGVSKKLAASFAADPGETIRILASDPNAAVIVNNLSHGDHRPEVKQEGIRAYVGIPLHVRGQVVGAMVALSRTTTDFGAADLDLLVSIGRQIGIAVERMRLLDRERRRARQLETVNEVGRRLGAMLTRERLLPEITTYVCEHLGYDALNILLLDQEGHELVLDAASGLGNEALVGMRVSVNDLQSITGWVATNGQPLVVNDVRGDPRHFRTVAGALAELAVPIQVGGRMLGVLDAQAARVNAFHDADINVLETLAAQVAVALDNARLYADTRRSLKRTRAFQQVATALTASLELRTTLEYALDAAMSVFDADRAALYLADAETGLLNFAAARNLSAEYMAAVNDYYGRADAPRAIEVERSIYVEDARSAALVPQLRAASRREGFRSQLFLPLRHSGRMLGTFVLYHDHVRRYTDEETAQAQTFADQAAVAIQHARLYEDMQRSLRRTRAFQEVATAISGSLDLQPTLERALDLAMGVFEADRAALFLGAPESTGGSDADVTAGMRCVAWRNLSVEYLTRVRDYYAEPRASQPALTRDRIIYIEDAQTSPALGPLSDAIRREGFRSLLFLPLRGGADYLGSLVLYHDGVRRYRADDMALAQTFADQAGVAIEHARLFEAERRAREQASTILDVTRTVTSSLRLDDVLRNAAGCIAVSLQQRYCGIWMLSDDGAELRPVCAIADPPDAAAGAAFNLLTPVRVADFPRLDALLRTDQPAVVRDLDDLSASEQAMQRVIGFSAYIDIPLVAADRTIGFAAVPLFGPDLSIAPDRLEVAAAIGRSVALAAENARLYEQSRRLAVSEERNRLARELHDSVVHSLFSMSLIAQALPRILDRDVTRARERIDRLSELSRNALAEMRALIFELRPAALEDEGLASALARHVAAFEAREGIRVELAVEGDRRLPAAVEEAVFRVAQEALNNVAKHAGAGHVAVRIAAGNSDIVLSVTDDGAGFDPARPRTGGGRTLGMTSMRERGALLGGECVVESTPGAGTTVRLRLPLDAV